MRHCARRMIARRSAAMDDQKNFMFKMAKAKLLWLVILLLVLLNILIVI
jgi:hypothetical protein